MFRRSVLSFAITFVITCNQLLEIVNGAGTCVWCERELTTSYMNCLYQKFASSPIFEDVSSDLLKDMRNSILAASFAMTKTQNDMKDKIMTGALAGEVSSMILSSGDAMGPSIKEAMKLTGDCYTVVTGNSKAVFVSELGKSVQNMIKDSAPSDFEVLVIENSKPASAQSFNEPDNFNNQQPLPTIIGIQEQSFQPEPISSPQQPTLFPNQFAVPQQEIQTQNVHQFLPPQQSAPLTNPVPQQSNQVGIPNSGQNANLPNYNEYQPIQFNNPQQSYQPDLFVNNAQQNQQANQFLPLQQSAPLIDPVPQQSNQVGIPDSGQNANLPNYNQYQPIQFNNPQQSYQPDLFVNNGPPNQQASPISASNIPATFQNDNLNNLNTDQTYAVNSGANQFEPNFNFPIFSYGNGPNNNGGSPINAEPATGSLLPTHTNIGTQSPANPQLPLGVKSPANNQLPLAAKSPANPQLPIGATSGGSQILNEPNNSGTNNQQGNGNDGRSEWLQWLRNLVKNKGTPSPQSSHPSASPNTAPQNLKNNPENAVSGQNSPSQLQFLNANPNNAVSLTQLGSPEVVNGSPILKVPSNQGNSNPDNTKSQKTDAPSTTVSPTTPAAISPVTTTQTPPTSQPAPENPRKCAMKFAEIMFVQLLRDDRFSCAFGENTPHDLAVLAASQAIAQGLSASGFSEFSDEASKYASNQVQLLKPGATTQAYGEKVSKSAMAPLYKYQVLKGNCEELANTITANILEVLPAISDSLSAANENQGPDTSGSTSPNTATDNAATNPGPNPPNKGNSVPAPTNTQGLTTGNPLLPGIPSNVGPAPQPDTAPTTQLNNPPQGQSLPGLQVPAGANQAPLNNVQNPSISNLNTAPTNQDSGTGIPLLPARPSNVGQAPELDNVQPNILPQGQPQPEPLDSPGTNQALLNNPQNGINNLNAISLQENDEECDDDLNQTLEPEKQNGVNPSQNIPNKSPKLGKTGDSPKNNPFPKIGIPLKPIQTRQKPQSQVPNAPNIGVADEQVQGNSQSGDNAGNKDNMPAALNNIRDRIKYQYPFLFPNDNSLSTISDGTSDVPTITPASTSSAPSTTSLIPTNAAPSITTSDTALQGQQMPTGVNQATSNNQQNPGVTNLNTASNSNPQGLPTNFLITTPFFEASDLDEDNLIKVLMQAGTDSVSPDGYNYSNFIGTMTTVASAIANKYPDYSPQKVLMKTYSMSVVALTQNIQNVFVSGGSNQQSSAVALNVPSQPVSNQGNNFNSFPTQAAGPADNYGYNNGLLQTNPLNFQQNGFNNGQNSVPVQQNGYNNGLNTINSLPVQQPQNFQSPGFDNGFQSGLTNIQSYPAQNNGGINSFENGQPQQFGSFPLNDGGLPQPVDFPQNTGSNLNTGNGF